LKNKFNIGAIIIDATGSGIIYEIVNILEKGKFYVIKIIDSPDIEQIHETFPRQIKIVDNIALPFNKTTRVLYTNDL